MARYTFFKPRLGYEAHVASCFRDDDLIRASREAVYQPLASGMVELAAGRAVREADLQRTLSALFEECQDRPGQRRSASKGDVLWIEGVGSYLVLPVGWEELRGYEADRFHDATPGEDIRPSEAGRAARARLEAIRQRMRRRLAASA